MSTTTADLSLEQQFALYAEELQEQVLAEMSEEQLELLPYDWAWGGRPSQILPVGPMGTPGFDWELALLNAGRGWGKLILMSTPVPTPTGWTTMSEIHSGDWVLDEQGCPCQVLVAHTPEMPERAYRMTFSDGTQIIAGGEHQWVTWTHAERKRLLRPGGVAGFPEDWAATQPIRTTDDLFATASYGSRGDVNHCIPVAGALALPEQSLPVEPWVLGYWLGNGGRGTSQIVAGSKDGDFDADHVASCLGAAGHTFSRRDLIERGHTLFGVPGLIGRLRAAGVDRRKHIPEQYLRASVEQRLALLRGLMDSDGYCGDNNHAEFCSTSQELADGVLELVRTLSERPTVTVGRAQLNGEDYGLKYRVKWRPSVYNPFALPRKAARVRPVGAQALRLRHRMIKSIEPVEPQLMRCLTVDSPNSMYLVSESMIPTHNTLAGAQYIRAVDEKWPTLGRDPGQQLRVALLGRTAADVRDTIINGQSGLMNIYPPSLQDQIDWIPTQRRVNLPGGGMALCFSAEQPDQLRGPQFHVAWGDEIAAYKQVKGQGELDAWTNLRIATRLGQLPQLIATTTPKRVPLMRALLAEIAANPGKMMLRSGKTTDNVKLSSAYLTTLFALYGGTTLGAQELDGLMLDAVEGATVDMEVIDAHRVQALPRMDGTRWIKIVAVDPSVAEKPNDECGIVVIYAPLTNPILNRHAYVVQDLSLKASPDVWADRVVTAAHKHGAAVVVENNQGGALVKRMIKEAATTANVPPPQVREVWSTKSKKMRAEPIGAAYQRGRVHHLYSLPELEDQLCFPAGTSVETRRGHIPIETVVEGDEVMTRGGWAPVAWAGQTGVSDQFQQVVHVGGCVVSTPWHQLWTNNRGFVPAQHVLPSDLLAARPSPGSTARLPPDADGGGTAHQLATTGTPEDSCSIERPGKRTEARSTPLSRYTTATSSSGTTASRTWSWLTRMVSTCASTMPTIVGSGAGREISMSLLDWPAGRTGSPTPSSVLDAEPSSRAQVNEPSGAPAAAGSAVSTSRDPRSDTSASSAAVGTSTPTSGPGFARRAVVGSSAIKIGSPVPVYDLTVADGHLPEFYADGVLVHNCTWTPTDSGYSPDRLDAVVHGLAAALFPQALIKGGVPGASGHASPVGQRIDGSRMSAQPRRPGGGLRVDTGGRGRPATVPGLPSRSSFGAAGRRLIVPGRTR